MILDDREILVNNGLGSKIFICTSHERFMSPSVSSQRREHQMPHGYKKARQTEAAAKSQFNFCPASGSVL
jgi:hypothetical protein